jgi:nucleoside-diphosphate-sugar epimerase
MGSVGGRALVCGGGGFIGNHLIKRLKRDGLWVRAVDLVRPLYSESEADEFVIGDLRDAAVCRAVMDIEYDEVYQLAADTGGIGYLATGENDADVLRNLITIDVNVLAACEGCRIGRLFFASTACVYPQQNLSDPDHPHCEESSVYPADPDTEFGWGKLISERLYLAHARNKGIMVRIGRYHSIFGPENAWDGGREKVPAAICRKVLLARSGGAIEVWGDGRQTRSFLFIDDCIEATVRLVRSDFQGPVNIGSEDMVTIDQLVDLIASVAGKKIVKAYRSGPVGVRGRNSDNRLIRKMLGWSPTVPLRTGLEQTYRFVESEIRKRPGSYAMAMGQ